MVEFTPDKALNKLLEMNSMSYPEQYKIAINFNFFFNLQFHLFNIILN